MARDERLLTLAVMIGRHQKINWKKMHVEYDGEALDLNKTPAELKWASKQTYPPLVTIERDIDAVSSDEEVTTDEEEVEVTTGKTIINRVTWSDYFTDERSESSSDPELSESSSSDLDLLPPPPKKKKKSDELLPSSK